MSELENNKMYAKLPHEYLKMILNFEGGLTKEKTASTEGFLTNRGITEGALASAKKMGLVAQSVTIQSLTTDLESVRKIYETNYYLKSKCDKLPHPLAFAHLDLSVNGGVGRGAINLQNTINCFTTKKITVDGGIGPNTLNALNLVLSDVKINVFTKKYNDLREKFYRDLAASNPKRYSMFLKGWLNRLNSVRKYTD